jgi:hypothetical protein
MVEDTFSWQQVLSPRVAPLKIESLDKGSGNLISSNKALAGQEPSASDKRRVDRAKAVLPVRISGQDVSGSSYFELVHTLDVSKAGVRLGAVRRQLEVGSPITIQYRQHKAEFRIIWIKPLGTGPEQQVGLQADAQRDLWGLDSSAKNQSQAATLALNNHVSVGA